jgi:hypothetical protein
VNVMNGSDMSADCRRNALGNFSVVRAGRQSSVEFMRHRHFKRRGSWFTEPMLA